MYGILEHGHIPSSFSPQSYLDTFVLTCSDTPVYLFICVLFSEGFSNSFHNGQYSYLKIIFLVIHLSCVMPDFFQTLIKKG